MHRLQKSCFEGGGGHLFRTGEKPCDWRVVGMVLVELSVSFPTEEYG